MSNAARVLDIAAGDVGISELTGNNDGPQIRAWQELAEAHYDDYPKGSLLGAPWCAIWVHSVFHRAGLSVDHGLTHPWTGTICDTASRLGIWLPAGQFAPPASILVSCGIHTGIVVRDRGNGLLDTIEGNAGNAVRRLVRNKAEWRIVVPPGIAGVAVPAIVMVDSYGFDDLTVRPDTWGGWASRAGRDSTLERFKRAHPDLWAAAVLLDSQAAPYGFRSGKRGTYGATWRFGGWPTKAAREERVEAYCRARGREPGHGIRIWSKRVPVAAGGKATTGVTTT